ncbi:MAG: hypothetical protein E7428_05130 [Ruminococcaceae bacterium]|nr:hypothetical protein [Oscillospiraceae bacterium]
MKRSKKGVTLVELIICCAITVMLAGACTAVLISGQRVWKSGSESANAQMTADVMQTNLYNRLPTMNGVTVTDVATAKAPSAGAGMTMDGWFSLYLDGEDGEAKVFTMNAGGNTTTLEDVTDLSFAFTKAGDPDSDTARAQFVYTATLVDGREFSGGLVISNLKFEDITGYTDGAEDNTLESGKAILFTKTSEVTTE